MNQKNFFAKQEPHTAAKTDIVVDYFLPWARIMDRICESMTYLDLFSGPGVFDDGTPSTPVLVLRKAAQSDTLKSKLHMHFYEADRSYCQRLESVLKREPAYSEMTNKPIVNHAIVDESLINNLPSNDCTLTFIDPYGYSGVTLDLLTYVIRCWGSDCIFFLSTSGILRNVERHEERDKLVAIFGEEALDGLCVNLSKTGDYWKKHLILLRAINIAMLRASGRDIYFLPLGFEFEARKQLSHFLIFVTKHHRGYAIMKEIMAKYSLKDSDDIPRYLISSIRAVEEFQYALPFGGEGKAMSRLKLRLRQDFSEKSLNMRQLLDTCHRTKYPHIKRNIKDAVGQLESEGRVTVDIHASERKVNGKPTLGEKRIVTFERFGESNG